MGRLRLLGPEALRVRGDARASPFRNGAFDLILLDAPCSSMGIIRKHPEIKWRRNEADIAAFGNLQLDLLRRLWDNLRAGGHMVYSVCSFEPEETTEVIERFRGEKKFVEEDALPALPNHGKGPFLSVPHETGMDGFFIARLKKP
jgi:16S rRNA (cytosine967-C5)-methyltransferase